MANLETLRLRFAPLKSKSYRLLFVSQGVSLIGSWMQELARSWIVLNLMGRASSLGILMLASAAPNLIFGSFGGSLADRRSAREILLLTQGLFAVLAFALGVLVSSGHIQFWHLLMFAVLEGLLMSFDIPALNTVTPQLIPREDFQQALALNSVSFHLARFIGPSLAGLVMGLAGPAAVFWLNAVSFAGILWALTKLPLAKKGAIQGTASSGSFRETFAYIKARPALTAVLIQFLLVIGLVFPLVFTTLRLHIQSTFHLSAKEFGYVFAAPGLGALIGSVYFFISSPPNPMRILPWSVGGVVVFLVSISQAVTLWATVLCLIGFSVAMFLTMSALLVTVQLMIDHHIRGRISAITGMAFASLAPLMGAPMGFATDYFGTRHMMLSVACLFGLLSAFVGLKGIRAETKSA